MDEFRMEKWGKRKEEARAFIRQHYGDNAPEPMTNEAIAETLGVSIGTVWRLACKMRLAKMKYFTQEEENFIRQHFGKSAKERMSAEAIGKALGRNPSYIYEKARAMGLVAKKQCQVNMSNNAVIQARIARYAAIVASGRRLFEPTPGQENCA